MSTSCARTPTSSLTWDVQTPPAPCSPPPHRSPPTDWLFHTDWQDPLANLKAGLLELEDNGCGFFSLHHFFLLELFPNGSVSNRAEWNEMEMDEDMYLCICCTELFPWTQLYEIQERAKLEKRRGIERERGNKKWERWCWWICLWTVLINPLGDISTAAVARRLASPSPPLSAPHHHTPHKMAKNLFYIKSLL